MLKKVACKGFKGMVKKIANRRMNTLEITLTTTFVIKRNVF
jgi:hypothetical protein